MEKIHVPRLLAAAVLSAFALSSAPVARADPVPGGTLDPTTIPKYASPLVIPPAMPKSGVLPGGIDYYEIGIRQFQQQVLPAGMPATSVMGYGSVDHPGTFSYPGRTIEANVDRPVRVKWINDLVSTNGKFVPHLFPVDQTLHWANPPKDCIDGAPRTDCRGQSQAPYTGPIPIITHLHGAHSNPDSDGFPEAWYLPDAKNIPAGYARTGSRFDQIPGAPNSRGAALFQYRNDQRATTLWYHDHALGMTRANVYAGLAGFYLLRGGSTDLPNLVMPSPAPQEGDPAGKRYHEIPLVIQDRSFNANGSLFFPTNRAFFEGLNKPGAPEQFPGAGVLDVPFIPQDATGGRSDVSPIWNPEFFGNTMVVNGKTWPVLEVEKMRYRFRVLNGSDSRFLILKMVTGDPTARPAASALPFWQIGSDGGFLPAPVRRETLLVALAERADIIVDFSHVPVGTEVYLINEGPDEPFGGGVGGVDFDFADPGTTGQVMKFKVVPRRSFDLSLPPQFLPLPRVVNIGPATNVRRLSLNEFESQTVSVTTQPDGSVVFDPAGDPFGPTSASLGTVDAAGNSVPNMWGDPTTENPGLGTEIWEINNFTADAHPIHVHQTMFQVVNRQELATDDEGVATQPAMLVGDPIPPDVGENGFKDTIIAYPGQVTRIKVFFDIPGLYVWHCHIISHEDNEMMRPFCVGGGCSR
jgi:FtsP/CotA-like multicopper oxidase with cupredoxin domain